MARQKKATKDNAADTSMGFTPERFERELKDLASKAKNDTWSNRVLGQVVLYVKTLVLLTLLGVYSNASQLALSPVYGSIPAAAWHSKALMAGCFIGWAGNLAFRQVLPISTEKLLPLVALYVPVMQCFLYRFSQTLGANYGPLVTEGVTLVPMAILTAASVADNLEGVDLSSMPKVLADAVPGVGSWGTFKLIEHIAEMLLRKHVGTVFWYTRVGMEILLAGSYTVFAPSKYLALAIPALVHTAMFNPHVDTPTAMALLNTTMLADNWMILDRRESVTGYISVVEQTRSKMRVLRADHSLLGGDWAEWRGNQVTEPIYAIFVMLEAVRLVEREVPVADADAKALVIGMGIGTAPSALVSHGIETTVVEIDPVVYEFAQKYFQLRENHPAVIEDAVKYTNRAANETQDVYDYIVHDVFTGGVEPVDLFTFEFFQNLYTLLKSDGVIAINYAGDLRSPTPKAIVRTILKNFPTCRIFRENLPDDKAIAETGSDFTNMVIFCRKAKGALTFRNPVKEDYLNSPSRQNFLTPQNEVLPGDVFSNGKDEEGFLFRNGTDKVKEGQYANAAGHWAVMRSSLPATFWERW
ncbi:spermine/spermidine synthase domain-containing protein [Trichoderma breve]|uniref:Spermine/spermidine synthase domain-containing protein n=1 Tax=Trichoderma breve TaxID=2034170 RepID=A0A9W9BEW9_9HYPO|nr:spermine/spermidine synthase domain-containing protein [Trichoderma breve]KAJ4858643.1 spermine/spermidine synthase domain-containing protein [Trichoderma breve]